MHRLRAVIKRIMSDPRVVFDRLYYMVRGIRAMEMKRSSENDAGTIAALSTLSAKLAGKETRLMGVAEVVGDLSHDLDTKELSDLFARHGSDKSTTHEYHLIYAHLLKRRRGDPLQILEIGLGTNNTDVPSNMGKNARPGASLRAFRDWGRQFKVYGADVDDRILFSEERIETFFVDQTKPETLNALAARFPRESFDLIIDDGLHTTCANLNTVNFALDLIKPGGYLVVEDILNEHLSAWNTALPLLENKYRCLLVTTKNEIVCIVQK